MNQRQCPVNGRIDLVFSQLSEKDCPTEWRPRNDRREKIAHRRAEIHVQYSDKYELARLKNCLTYNNVLTTVAFVADHIACDKQSSQASIHSMGMDGGRFVG